MARYITSTETRAETKVYKFIFVSDFFFLLFGFIIALMGSVMVHSALKVPYWIFTAVCLVFLILPSRSNPKRRNYMSIILMFGADHHVYKPIPYVHHKKIRLELEEKHGKDYTHPSI